MSTPPPPPPQADRVNDHARFVRPCLPLSRHLSSIISRQRNRYLVSEIPYPFTSREQYERSLRQPIGGEWNTSQSVKDMTRPAVVVRAGTAVAPMKLGKLHKDSAKERRAAVAAQEAARGGSGGGSKGRKGKGGARKGTGKGRA